MATRDDDEDMYAQKEEMMIEEEASEGGYAFNDQADMERRQVQRQFYQKVDKTQEFAENNYYHITHTQVDLSISILFIPFQYL